MEKIVSFDKQGRIYLPEEMRKYLQFKTFIAKSQGKVVFIEPIEANPLDALSRLGKKLTKSVHQLKKEARDEIEKDVTKKIRRY